MVKNKTAHVCQQFTVLNSFTEKKKKWSQNAAMYKSRPPLSRPSLLLWSSKSLSRQPDCTLLSPTINWDNKFSQTSELHDMREKERERTFRQSEINASNMAGKAQPGHSKMDESIFTVFLCGPTGVMEQLISEAQKTLSFWSLKFSNAVYTKKWLEV